MFLDEPLANLGHKLREELREQLPRLCAGRRAVAVYATSEPEEALLLGGKTALMEDGSVTQFGPTTEIYRNPANLSAARAFTDPPINVAEITKSGSNATLGNDANWPLETADLPDGTDYTIAVRTHRVLPQPIDPAQVALKGNVIVTGLSGSDPSAPFRICSTYRVSLASGVHP